jgi:hypothetical protein
MGHAIKFGDDAIAEDNGYDLTKNHRPALQLSASVTLVLPVFGNKMYEFEVASNGINIRYQMVFFAYDKA